MYILVFCSILNTDKTNKLVTRRNRCDVIQPGDRDQLYNILNKQQRVSSYTQMQYFDTG